MAFYVFIKKDPSVGATEIKHAAESFAGGCTVEFYDSKCYRLGVSSNGTNRHAFLKELAKKIKERYDHDPYMLTIKYCTEGEILQAYTYSNGNIEAFVGDFGD